METRYHSRANVDGDRQNRSTDGPTKLFVNNNDVDDGMIDLPKGVRLCDIELTRAWRRGGFNPACPPLAGRCQRDPFRPSALDGAPVRRGQTFRQAGFPNTPQECSKAWFYPSPPEAIHLLGDDTLGSRVQPG